MLSSVFFLPSTSAIEEKRQENQAVILAPGSCSSQKPRLSPSGPHPPGSPCPADLGSADAVHAESRAPGQAALWGSSERTSPAHGPLVPDMQRHLSVSLGLSTPPNPPPGASRNPLMKEPPARRRSCADVGSRPARRPGRASWAPPQRPHVRPLPPEALGSRETR